MRYGAPLCSTLPHRKGLRRALANDSPAVRARAFDIVYNMAIHGELLLPNETGLLADEMQVSHCSWHLPAYQ